MFGIAAIVSFAVATLLQGAGLSKGDILTPAFFGLLGLTLLAIHLVTGWLHR